MFPGEKCSADYHCLCYVCLTHQIQNSERGMDTTITQLLACINSVSKGQPLQLFTQGEGASRLFQRHF